MSSPAPAYIASETEQAERRRDGRAGWLLWENRSFIVSVAWKAVIFGVVLSLLIPVQYESTTRLVPGQNFGSSVSMLAAMGAKAGGEGLGLDLSALLGARTPGAFFVSILESRTVQDDLINRFDLRTVYGTRYYTNARKMLVARTTITEDKKGGVITVGVRDHAPDRAAALAQAYADEVNRLAAQFNTSAAHRERLFLAERLNSQKQELDTAEKELSEFSSRYSAIDIKEQGRAIVGAAAALQGELIAAESQLSGLEQIYSDDNVRIKTLRARISELKRQLTKIGGDYTPTDSSNPQQDALYPSIRSLPALGYRYVQYYRRAKVAETVYELLTQQHELAKIQEAKELPVIVVMDRADVPERKTFPPRTLIVLFSMIASVILACLWVLQKAWWNEVPDDNPNKQLAQEVYGRFLTRTIGMRQRVGRVFAFTRKNSSVAPVDFRDNGQ